MYSRLRILLCGLLFLCDTGGASPSGRANLQQDKWVAARVNALVRAARSAYENDDAAAAYKRLVKSTAAEIKKRNLSEDVDFARRYPEFLDYVQSASVAFGSDRQLGFAVPDKQYFAETRQYVQIPDFLMTQNFLRAVSRSESLGQAKAYLRRLNEARNQSNQLAFFSYESRHLGTPDNDNSFRRLLIVVPGNDEIGLPDKWVQFGVTDPGPGKRIRNVSVISALNRPDGTFDAYFKDYFRTYHRNGSISVVGRWESGNGDDNCAVCHKSGILPIFPVDGTVSPAEQPALQEINQRFQTYGKPRFGKYLDERRFGPGIGSATVASRDQRFGNGFSSTNVGRAMNCVACHQHDGLGALNWPMDRVLIKSYITGGQMPFGSRLTDPERLEVYRKLITEYFAVDDANPGILKAWLLGASPSSPGR